MCKHVYQWYKLVLRFGYKSPSKFDYSHNYTIFDPVQLFPQDTWRAQIWSVKFWRATHEQEGRMGRGIWNCFNRPQPYLCCGQIWTCQVFVEKVGQGQRLSNCVDNLILEGYPRAGGQMERGLWTFFDRPQPYLGQAVGCVVKVSARGSEGRRVDTRLHQLSD